MTDDMQTGTSERAFDPWIGTRYASHGIAGIKLLILGESQYAKDVMTEPIRGKWDADKESTREIIRWLAIEGRGAFCTKIAKTVLGHDRGRAISNEDLADFWQRVAFYNFVQWWLPRARSRPTAEMWLDAHDPLLKTLGECQPHCLLVLGKELSARLPLLPEGLKRIDIFHPSSRGFSYARWNTVVRAGMRRNDLASSQYE